VTGTGQWHVYVALSGCEHAVVYECSGRHCDGCANCDALYRTRNDAYRAADRIDTQIDAELAGFQ
jgi:hypothetical protein